MKRIVARCCSIALLAILIAVPMAEAKKDTLVVAFDRRMMTLDNNETTDRSSLVLYHNWGDTLVYRDPVKREMVPCLAESYTFIDAMTIEVKLRKGVVPQRRTVQRGGGPVFDGDPEGSQDAQLRLFQSV